MAQQILKKLKYDNAEVIVEAANRDGSGNQISSTYATKTELSEGLGTKQGSLSVSTPLTLTNNTLSVGIATDAAVGVAKFGHGLNVTAAGLVTVQNIDWSDITSNTKPFNTISTGTGGDFVLSEGMLTIDSTKFATKSHVSSTYVAISTYEGFINTTAPATYQHVIDADHKVSYNYLLDKPTDLGDFGNTAGYIKNTVDDLINYYTKTETYTKGQVDALVQSINSFEYHLASELPTATAETMHDIYFIPASRTESNNIKNEFITIKTDNGVDADPRYTYSWEQIGSTSVDLTNYVHSDAIIGNNVIVVGDGGTRKVKDSGYTISGSVSNSSTTVPTNAAVYASLGDKQDTLTQAANAGNGITISNAGVIASVITATDVTLDY